MVLTIVCTEKVQQCVTWWPSVVTSEVVVVTGYITLLVEATATDAEGATPAGLKELRVLRTLRPLKLVNKSREHLERSRGAGV